MKECHCKEGYRRIVVGKWWNRAFWKWIDSLNKKEDKESMRWCVPENHCITHNLYGTGIDDMALVLRESFDITPEVEKYALTQLNCEEYCEDTGCDWTEKYKCPWDNRKGGQWAKNDLTHGYNCCCARRTSTNQLCGGVEVDTCEQYCSQESEGHDPCSWTEEWRCPNWEVKKGSDLAKNDDSLGFECCCKKRPTPNDTCGGTSVTNVKSTTMSIYRYW